MLKMIDLLFLEEQLHATPFVPFVLILNSGDRYNIKTPDRADLPPPDEETDERNPWFIVYNARGVPRYLRFQISRASSTANRQKIKSPPPCRVHKGPVRLLLLA